MKASEDPLWEGEGQAEKKSSGQEGERPVQVGWARGRLMWEEGFEQSWGHLV